MFSNFIGPLNGSEIGINYDTIDDVKNKKIVFNVGNDNEAFLSQLFKNKKDFVVYVGTHGGEGAKYADLVIPCSAWTE